MTLCVRHLTTRGKKKGRGLAGRVVWLLPTDLDQISRPPQRRLASEILISPYNPANRRRGRVCWCVGVRRRDTGRCNLIINDVTNQPLAAFAAVCVSAAVADFFFRIVVADYSATF